MKYFWLQAAKIKFPAVAVCTCKIDSGQVSVSMKPLSSDRYSAQMQAAMKQKKIADVRSYLPLDD